MAVEYINGQFYNAPDGGMMYYGWKSALERTLNAQNKGVAAPFDAVYPIGAPNRYGQAAPKASQTNNGMFSNPFSTAMSGTQTGTLQPYVNRMTQNASNALYGGLLNYSPQSLIAGDAGGTPQNSTAPQFNLPSAIGQGLNFTGFGNRSWMNQGGQ